VTPQQKVKTLLLAKASELDNDKTPMPEINADNVDDLYNQLVEAEEHWDAMNEVREGEVETHLPTEYSRHYEAKAVAAKMPDGSWVGWTYWYGGGKHGEPQAIDWIEDAYNLTCTEEEKLVVVQTFSRTTE
jgi:hypothetical protein